MSAIELNSLVKVKDVIYKLQSSFLAYMNSTNEPILLDGKWFNEDYLVSEVQDDGVVMSNGIKVLDSQLANCFTVS